MSSSRTYLSFLILSITLSCWAQPTMEEVDRNIDTHRKGQLVIEAPTGTPVTVEQLGHEFWFGAALANQPFSGRMNPKDQQTYLAVFLTIFNAAVTENAL